MPATDPIYAAALQAARTARYWRGAAEGIKGAPAGRTVRSTCIKLARAYEEQVRALATIAEHLAAQTPAHPLAGLDVIELPDTPTTAAAHHALLVHHQESLTA
jgi:hypothetical protein